MIGEITSGTENEKGEIKEIYRRRAPTYDFETNVIYDLIGVRVGHHRKRAVAGLNLQRGATVVEIGCGTGGNFELLEAAIGPEGRLIGVDLSRDMLRVAEERVKKHGWQNITLLNVDASSFRFPEVVDGVLSTFAITLIPEYDQVIRAGARSLAPGRRFVIMDFKMPSGVLARLAPLLVFLVKPYGGTLEMTGRHPWESLSKYLQIVSFTEFYFGLSYIAVAEKPADKAPKQGS